METAGSGKVLRGALKRNAIMGYMGGVAPVVDHPFIYLELWIPLSCHVEIKDLMTTQEILVTIAPIGMTSE